MATDLPLDVVDDTSGPPTDDEETTAAAAVGLPVIASRIRLREDSEIPSTGDSLSDESLMPVVRVPAFGGDCPFPELDRADSFSRSLPGHLVMDTRWSSARDCGDSDFGRILSSLLWWL